MDDETELVPYPETATGMQDDFAIGGDRAPATASAALAKARAADRCDVGFCLRYVRTWWGVGPKYASAWKAWLGSDQHEGDRTPPLGAPVFYRGGNFGHIALFAGDGKIISTDCSANGRVGRTDLDWPQRRWGHSYVGWGGSLNGVTLRFDAAAPTMAVDDLTRGPVFVAKLRFGQRDSDSVKRLQHRLNAVVDAGLPVTGNYLEKTRAAVKDWQRSIGETGTAADGNLGPKQALRLFPTPPYDVKG
jgi:hypothetical protein